MRRVVSRNRVTKQRAGWARALDFVLATAILGLGIVFVARMDRVATQTLSGAATIHDGDTLTVGSVRMRLKGIDAPEYQQSCSRSGTDYSCGREARRALSDIVGVTGISCEGWERDRYGRLLTTCFAAGQDINAEMVRLGWAVSYGDYRAQEAEARTARRGLWQGDFQRPQEWRAAHQHRQPDSAPHLGERVLNWLRQLLGASPAS